MSKIKYLIAFCIILISNSFIYEVVFAEENVKPIVVIREDDCRSDWRIPYPEFGNISALSYGKQKKIPITWGIITFATASGYALTWSELADYISTAGGEAASHSVNHGTYYSNEDYFYELINSKAAIISNLGNYFKGTFLQPGTWINDAFLDRFYKLDNPIGQTLQSHYSQSMAYLGDGWSVGKNYYKYGLTNVYSIDYQPNLTVENLQNILDIVANTPGLIFVVSCHGIQPTGGTKSYAVPANILKAFFDKLADPSRQRKD